MGQQRAQLPPGGLGAVGAADDPDQVGRHTGIPRAGPHPVRDGLDHLRGVQLVGLGHEVRAEAQLDVVDALVLGVLHVLVGDPAAGVVVHHDLAQPAELLEKRQHPGLRLGHLHERAQAFQVRGGQRQVVLPPQVEDGLQTNAAVEVAVQVDQRKVWGNHHARLPLWILTTA